MLISLKTGRKIVLKKNDEGVESVLRMKNLYTTTMRKFGRTLYRQKYYDNITIIIPKYPVRFSFYVPNSTLSAMYLINSFLVVGISSKVIRIHNGATFRLHPFSTLSSSHPFFAAFNEVKRLCLVDSGQDSSYISKQYIFITIPPKIAHNASPTTS